jgi:hypothetical protein
MEEIQELCYPKFDMRLKNSYFLWRNAVQTVES